MTIPVNMKTGADYTDIAGLESLKRDPNSPQARSAVASQVEAMFLQMMLKSMRDASIGDPLFDSNEGKLYQDMYDKQIALTMSQHQNVGIGALLLRQLENKAAADGTAPARSPVHAPAAPVGAAGSGQAPAPDPRPADSRRAKTSALTPSPRQFVAKVLPSIEQAARKIGVNPMGLLAQAALETGWGQRVLQGEGGSSSHNLFGVKAGADWSGARVHAETIEFDGRLARQKREAFRSYASIEESVNDFTHLLMSSPRYRDAIAAGRDPQAYAAAVGAAGYATDPQYSQKLARILNGDTLRMALAQTTAGLQK